ncbi:hypothetical protein HPB49_010584 [Dermacentor silvarum]|uniref:Uncharacterized protein n=1 Tax=Dermacentor silvarum TaxID=543639 RepID=A0ACB8DCE6_DERSI|nr:hypothetical protein HPB49_010584 [Dermacentor silvarum]
MDKDSADRLESPTSEASSPAFRRRQRANRPRVLPARTKSLTAKDVNCHDNVESTTNLLSSDVGFLEAAEQEPPIAVGVTSSGSTRIDCNDAFLLSEASSAMMSHLSDASRQKVATPSQECASPHATPSAHVTRPQTPERSSALASRSRNLPKTSTTSTSSLKKRERPNKSVPEPVSPRPTTLTHTLSQSEDGNPAVLDVCATSAYDNAASPSTANEGARYPHTLDQISPTSALVSLALAPIMGPSPLVVRSPADSSPESVLAPNAAQKQQSPASPGLADGRLPLRSSHKASPTSPVTALAQRVAYPRESCVSSTLRTKSSSSFSVTASGYKQPADAPISKDLEGSSATGIGSPQPLLGDIALSVVGSKVESPTANEPNADRKHGDEAQDNVRTVSVMGGLCYIVVISSATLALLALVFLTHRTHSTYIEECASGACDRAMSSFWALMEDSVDPCGDFYGHVCRRWDNTTGGRLKYLDHTVQQIAHRVNQNLHDVDEFGASLETRGVAQFYKLCLGFVTSPDRYISRSQIMHSFGADKRDRLLTLTKFGDIVATLVDLSLSRRLNTVFGVKLVRRAGAAQVNVFPGKTLAETVSPHSADAWRGYLGKLLVDVATAYPSKKFDLDSLNRTDDTVRQLLYSPDVADNVREAVDAGSLDFLGDATSANTWLAAVNSHLPSDEQLSSKSKVLVTSYGTVRNVLHFLGSLADNGVTYLYLHLLFEVFRFDYVRSLQDRSPVDLVKECLQASQDVMWHTRNVLTANIFGGRSEGTRKTTDILRKVAQAASSQVQLSLRGEAMRRRAHKMFSTVSLHVHDWYAWNATSFVIGERAVTLVSEARAIDFPSIYVRLKEEQNRAFLSNARADSDTDDKLHVLDRGVRYDEGVNEVVVPASLRIEPVLYTEDVPFAFAAGMLGTLIATELYRAAIPDPGPPMWQLQQRALIAKFQDCAEQLANDALNISIATLSDGRLDSRRLPSNIIWMLAARTAYETLRFATLSFKQAINWPSYWRKWQRTFFRRFCLLMCGSGEEDSGRSGVTPRVLCLLTVASMPEFSEVFDCQDNSIALRYTTCILG